MERNDRAEDVRRFEAAFAQAWYSKHGSEAGDPFRIKVEFTSSDGQRRGLCRDVLAGERVQSVEADMREAFGLGLDGTRRANRREALKVGDLVLSPDGQPYQVARIDLSEGKYGAATVAYAGTNLGIHASNHLFLDSDGSATGGWRRVDRSADSFKQWRKEPVGVAMNNAKPGQAVAINVGWECGGASAEEVAKLADAIRSSLVVPAAALRPSPTYVLGDLSDCYPKTRVETGRLTAKPMSATLTFTRVVEAGRPVQVGDVWRHILDDDAGDLTIAKVEPQWATLGGAKPGSWSMALTLRGTPEFPMDWTLVRPAPAKAEAPQVKVGQRYAPAIGNFTQSFVDRVGPCDVMCKDRDLWRLKGADGSMADNNRCLLGYMHKGDRGIGEWETEHVRQVAAAMRADQAERWQAWRGDASRGVR